jgi:cell division protein FtsZ
VAVVIVAGLGGQVGTGATPVIAKVAKEMGILTLAIVTLPFKNEGIKPYEIALNGLKNLKENVDLLLVINNEKLYDIYPDTEVFDPFPKSDNIAAIAVKSIVNTIVPDGRCIDFNDLRTSFSNSGIAVMGLGQASGENRIRKVVEQTLNSPLLNNSNISDAKNILINIHSGVKKPLTISELSQSSSLIKDASSKNARFKRYVIRDELLDEEIAMTIIASGLSGKQLFSDI